MSSGKTEKSVQTKIVNMLKAEGFWVLKIHGGMYQRPGIPDLLAIKDGLAYWIEVKRPGGKISPLQAKVIRELQDAGCKAGVADNIQGAKEILYE